MQGLIHVYYGYGKGKTTAAMGLALRSAGYDKNVVIVQFLKNRFTGELNALGKLDNVTVLRGQANDKCTPQMNEEEVEITTAIHNENFSKALSLVSENKCDLLVLDEALDAYQLDMLDRDMFENFVKNKPDELELVITGHVKTDWVNELADYVSEMVKLKHPYDRGIIARRGIEF